MAYKRMTSSLEQLCTGNDLNIFRNFIAPCLDRLTDLRILGRVSKAMRALIYSDDVQEIWNSEPIDLCVDSRFCFGCGRVRMTAEESFQLIAQAPIEYLRMHLPFDMLGKLLLSIVVKGTVRRLHLRFRSYDSSFADVSNSIIKIKNSHLYNKLNITNLTIFGWPSYNSLSSVGPVGTEELMKTCSMFLEMAGSRLTSLQLMESSPRGLLKIIETTCKELNFLALEGEQCISDLNSFDLKSVRVLSLQNIGIKLTERLNLSQLERFEYVDRNSSSLYTSVHDVISFILAIPKNIKELEVRFSSHFANIIIDTVAGHLIWLESFTMHIPETENSDDIAEDISLQSMTKLLQNCPKLVSFELMDGFIGFSPNAFELLGQFEYLQRIKLFYDDSITQGLVSVLETSRSIEEVILLENAGEIYSETGGSERWHEIEESLQKLSERFPGVLIGLRDCWWS